MRTMRFSRRDRRVERVLKRLGSIEPSYSSVPDADPVETQARLRRLRYGTADCRPGKPVLSAALAPRA